MIQRILISARILTCSRESRGDTRRDSGRTWPPVETLPSSIEGDSEEEVLSSLERAADFSLMSMFVASSRIVGLIMVKSLRYWRGPGRIKAWRNKSVKKRNKNK